MKSYTAHSDPAEIVSVRRSELSLLQNELARKLGYTNVNFISMVESGHSKVPLERAVDFANSLEMDARWFIEMVMRQRYPQIASELFDKKKK